MGDRFASDSDGFVAKIGCCCCCNPGPATPVVMLPPATGCEDNSCGCVVPVVKVIGVRSPADIGVFDIVVVIGMEGVVDAGSGDDGVGVDGSCVGNVCAIVELEFELDNGVDGGDDDIA